MSEEIKVTPSQFADQGKVGEFLIGVFGLPLREENERAVAAGLYAVPPSPPRPVGGAGVFLVPPRPPVVWQSGDADRHDPAGRCRAAAS